MMSLCHNWLGRERSKNRGLGGFFTGLRRALSMAIDREIITDKLSNAGELPAYGWVPPVEGYAPQQPEWAGWTREQRHAEARRLYAEAGYDDDLDRLKRIRLRFYALRKDGEYGAASLWSQTQFAVNDGGKSRHEDAAFVYKRPA